MFKLSLEPGSVSDCFLGRTIEKGCVGESFIFKQLARDASVRLVVKLLSLHLLGLILLNLHSNSSFLVSLELLLNGLSSFCLSLFSLFHFTRMLLHVLEGFSLLLVFMFHLSSVSSFDISSNFLLDLSFGLSFLFSLFHCSFQLFNSFVLFISFLLHFKGISNSHIRLSLNSLCLNGVLLGFGSCSCCCFLLLNSISLLFLGKGFSGILFILLLSCGFSVCSSLCLFSFHLSDFLIVLGIFFSECSGNSIFNGLFFLLFRFLLKLFFNLSISLFHGSPLFGISLLF